MTERHTKPIVSGWTIRLCGDVMQVGEECTHQVWHVLQTSQGGDDLRFELFGGLDAGAHDAAVFGVLAEPFVGVELWGVGGQVEQLQRAVAVVNEMFDGLGFVGGVAVDDELDRAVGVVDDLLAELDEPLGGEAAGVGGKPQSPLCADRGDHVQAVPGTGGLDDRGLPDRGPGGAGVVVRAQSGLVGEIDGGPDFLASARIAGKLILMRAELVCHALATARGNHRLEPGCIMHFYFRDPADRVVHHSARRRYRDDTLWYRNDVVRQYCRRRVRGAVAPFGGHQYR